MKGELPLGYVVFSLEPTHLTPGRLRLRFPEMRCCNDFFDELDGQITKWPVVLETQVRDQTGSYLILFSGSLAELLAQLSIIRKFKLVPREEIPHEKRVITFPKLTPKELATVKLLAYGGVSLFQAFHGRPFGPGTSLLEKAKDYWEEIVEAPE